MSRKDPENKLILGIVKGDAFSFDEIYHRYNEKVYTFALKNLKNREDAEEVVQDLFYSLWKDRDKLKEIENLNAWIFTVCFNIIRKRFRQIARERQHLQKFAEIAMSDDRSTLTEVEFNDLMNKAEAIIGKLPRQQKQVFLLRQQKGLSNADISETLNIAKKTVENHMNSARSYIKNALVKGGLLTIHLYWFFIR